MCKYLHIYFAIKCYYLHIFFDFCATHTEIAIPTLQNGLLAGYCPVVPVPHHFVAWLNCFSLFLFLCVEAIDNPLLPL